MICIPLCGQIWQVVVLSIPGGRCDVGDGWNVG